MTLTAWIALAVIIVTVWALIKRYETRLVLIGAGLLLCCISLDPMAALNQFAKSMTNNSLVMAICSSMGFAFAELHEVRPLARSLSGCAGARFGHFPHSRLHGDHVLREHRHSVCCGLRRGRGFDSDSRDAPRRH